MKLTLGFSPCPNDTFIFDALVNRKIDTEGLDFSVQLEDVQTLNAWAIGGNLDISKISYGVLPLLLDEYKLLRSGGALGKGVGPLLIARKDVSDLQSDIANMQIAIPGKNTTAHLLFSMAFPQATNKTFLVFNQIEEAVLSGATDAGVIIHENRFTYQDKGLVKLIDLGNYWEEQTNAPIPLGGIVMRKEISGKIIETVNKLIRQSVAYAFENYPFITDYVRQHAQEMDEEVMRKHIDLYVNDYSIDLGETGKKAVQKLMDVYAQINGLPVIDNQDYLA
ncbi:MAG: 1,4-dihydroxy-6-naphthoate synthase [Chitinophagaceae bacterium]|nr:1,4-dihydroxy-6-naphthoate synthase [Chitinophagaceae bacterium]